ncbi:hypothetical protein LINPERPRIM_LOCUS32915 [Linum perenne]
MVEVWLSREEEGTVGARTAGNEIEFRQRVAAVDGVSSPSKACHMTPFKSFPIHLLCLDPSVAVITNQFVGEVRKRNVIPLEENADMKMLPTPVSSMLGSWRHSQQVEIQSLCTEMSLYMSISMDLCLRKCIDNSISTSSVKFLYGAKDGILADVAGESENTEINYTRTHRGGDNNDY